MIRLLKWEIFKLTRQSRTYYALLALFVIEAFVMATAYFQGRDLISMFLGSIEQSFVLKGNLLNGNLLIYIILNSLWLHIPLILMIISSGLVCAEYKDGTIQNVMLQGVRKMDYILAKFGAAIIFTLVIMLLMAITATALAYLVFGKGDLVVYMDSLNFFPHHAAVVRIVAAFTAGTLAMVFYSCVSVLIGIIVEDATKAWILSALFVILSTLLIKIDWGNLPLKQYLYFNLVETWQQMFYYKVDKFAIVTNSILICAYSALVIILGSRLFIKKEIG